MVGGENEGEVFFPGVSVKKRDEDEDDEDDDEGVVWILVDTNRSSTSQ